MFGRKSVTDAEWATQLDASLRELGSERAEAEAFLARMAPDDRRRTERVLIRKGAKHWRRLETIMVRFGQLGPAGGVPTPTPTPDSSADAVLPGSETASAPVAESDAEQRARVNRALGR